MFAIIVMSSCSKEINPKQRYEIRLKDPFDGNVLVQTTDTVLSINGFNNHIKIKGSGLKMTNIHYKPTILFVNENEVTVK